MGKDWQVRWDETIGYLQQYFPQKFNGMTLAEHIEWVLQHPVQAGPKDTKQLISGELSLGWRKGVDDDDPTYFRLLFPNFWSIDSSPEHQRALLAAADVTAEIKVAKIYVLADDTQAAAEMFLADPDDLPRDLPRVFDRALQALQGAVNRFCELMQDRRPGLRLVESDN